MSDTIYRADAIEAVAEDLASVLNVSKDETRELAEHALLVLPSADAVSRELYEKRAQADERIIDSYRREFAEAASAEIVHKPDYSYEADMVKRLKKLSSADAVLQLNQIDTLIIANALRYLINDEERHKLDRAMAESLRERILKYGASMCKGDDNE